MAMQFRRNNQARKGKNNNQKSKKKSTFDKMEATLTRVEFADPGVYNISASLTGRCWVEWEPRADAPGPDKRLFCSQVGKTGENHILGEKGVKIPRGGKSLTVVGRQFMCFAPGTLKVWKQEFYGPEVGRVDRMLELPSSVQSEGLRSSVLMTIAGRLLGTTPAPAQSTHRASSGRSSGH